MVNIAYWSRAFLHRMFPIALILLASLSLRAQGIIPHSGDVAGTAGYSSMNGVDGDKHVLATGAGGYNINSHVAILGEYGFMSLGTSSSMGVAITQHLHLFGAATRFSIRTSRRISPYVVAGVGVNRINAAASGTSESSLTGVDFSAGGGATIFLRHHWGLRPEARYVHLQFGNPQANFATNTVLANTLNQSQFQLALSGFFQWGGTRGK